MHDPAAKRRDIVLVVDDTPGNLSFLTDTLDHAGVTVLVATDGMSALALVDQITPDLILMDAMMPGIDGFETCRRLKQDKQLTHVPVIFMTGLSESWHVVKGLEVGGVDYVTKPIVVDELLARIRVHLANARLAHGTRAALDAPAAILLSTDQTGRAAMVYAARRSCCRSCLRAATAQQLPPAVSRASAPAASAGRRRAGQRHSSRSMAAAWSSPMSAPPARPNSCSALPTSAPAARSARCRTR